MVIIIVSGCRDSNIPDNYLIRVGKSTMTTVDFNRAFDVFKIAYPYEALQNPEILKQTRVQFLHQMTERMIFIERAREMNIYISDIELEKAISRITEGYPEGEFEHTLLQSAVSYNSWKEELKIRLLMENVIEKDLESRIDITIEDIRRYYETYFKAKESQSADITDIVIRRLRRQKAEESYNSWIKDLRERYKVEINETKWKTIIESP